MKLKQGTRPAQSSLYVAYFLNARDQSASFSKSNHLTYVIKILNKVTKELMITNNNYFKKYGPIISAFEY